ncbi:MAG TPA: PaaI family thioesterase [Afifellaceae bacterium]|nr:PaaI family thioesterase [Afifellaceae bacterium]
MIEPVMTAAAVSEFLDREFPQMHAGGRAYRLLSVGPGEASMRLDPADRHLRPGGTVSGPALFALADYSAYAAILAHIGPVALAVTTNLNMNFLRRPPLGSLVGHCRILKLGKRLAVTEVAITPEGGLDLVAQATATYSLPPRKLEVI